MNAGAEDIDTLRENWWQELREDERANYTGNWDRRMSRVTDAVTRLRCIRGVAERHIRTSRRI